MLCVGTLAASGQTLTDEFERYPESSVGEPNWEVDSVGWEMTDGGIAQGLADLVGGDDPGRAVDGQGVREEVEGGAHGSGTPGVVA